MMRPWGEIRWDYENGHAALEHVPTHAREQEKGNITKARKEREEKGGLLIADLSVLDDALVCGQGCDLQQETTSLPTDDAMTTTDSNGIGDPKNFEPGCQKMHNN